MRLSEWGSEVHLKAVFAFSFRGENILIYRLGDSERENRLVYLGDEEKSENDPIGYS